ncbi:hypothetical protein AL470_007080 [Bartonella henselae str. Houston-1]|nr:hypothetical protein AL470_007080 [Bartonella henselae str. Houston-1]
MQDFLNNKIRSLSKVRPLSISSSTFSHGLVELEEAKITAKYIRKSWYFINPNFVFNEKYVVLSRHNNPKE